MQWLNCNLNSKLQLLFTPDEYTRRKRKHCHFFVTTVLVKTANSINAARSQRDRNRTQMSGSHRLGNFADTGDGAGCDIQRNDSRRPRNNAPFFRFLLVDIVRSWSPMTSFLPLLFDAARRQRREAELHYKRVKNNRMTEASTRQSSTASNAAGSGSRSKQFARSLRPADCLLSVR